MACMLFHDWGWPRRRGEKDIQVCVRCGSERESRIPFNSNRKHEHESQQVQPRLTLQGVADHSALPAASTRLKVA